MDQTEDDKNPISDKNIHVAKDVEGSNSDKILDCDIEGTDSINDIGSVKAQSIEGSNADNNIGSAEGTNSDNNIDGVLNNSINISKPLKTYVRSSKIRTTYNFGKMFCQNSLKRTKKRQLESSINVKRKRLEEEEEDSNFGSPYVVLTQDDGKPITCYMVPKKTDSAVDKYVATSAESVIKSQSFTPNEIPVTLKSSDKTRPDQTPVISPLLDVLRADLKSKLKEVPVVTPNISLPINTKAAVVNQNLSLPINTKANVVNQNISLQIKTNAASSLLSPQPSKKTKSPPSKLGIKVHSPVSLATAQPKPNQIQITMIDPKATTSSPQVITKTLSKVEEPFKPVQTQEPTFPVRQYVPKSKKEPATPAHFFETQKFLMDKIKALKAELDDTKWKLNDHEKRILYVKILEEKLVDKRRQIKTMCTQRKRLSKRLDSCRQELEKTRRALELVESQAVLWNNANMSELGKLIFGLHTVNTKKCLEAKTVAAKAPPEVKGFVISLYMTSPKAYQLVRDCFNGLPHPKTVAKWLHGDRPEPNEVQPSKPPVQVNNAALEETFSRVIESEEPVETVDQTGEQSKVVQESTQSETANTSVGSEIIQEGNATAIYYVLDEKGNVTGQLSSSEADMLFSTEGIDLESVPHHEIVIAE